MVAQSVFGVQNSGFHTCRHEIITNRSCRYTPTQSRHTQVFGTKEMFAAIVRPSLRQRIECLLRAIDLKLCAVLGRNGHWFVPANVAAIVFDFDKQSRLQTKSATKTWIRAISSATGPKNPNVLARQFVQSRLCQSSQGDWVVDALAVDFDYQCRQILSLIRGFRNGFRLANRIENSLADLKVFRRKRKTVGRIEIHTHRRLYLQSLTAR